MELLIKDRFYIPMLFPKKGNYHQFNLKKEIIKKIEISQEEREAIDWKEDAETKNITWDNTKDTPFIVDFSGDEINYLREWCEKISDEELPDDLWPTVAKIYDIISNETDQ